MSPETAARFPIRMLESGPAAGAHAASVLSRPLRQRNLLSFDMGGTSAKICLVRNHAPQVTVEFEAARLARFKRKSGLPVRIPVVDLIEIGAGGGSIARVDSLGLPAVGPKSAGSEPGPACYGRGGVEPTVTDADAVLGYLDPEYFLGGRLRLDTRAAEAALDEHVGGPLGMPAIEAAWTVSRQVNEQMARAAAVHASEHGVDLRRFALLAFGGAGPIHAAPVARALGIRRIFVPPEPGGALRPRGGARPSVLRPCGLVQERARAPRPRSGEPRPRRARGRGPRPPRRGGGQVRNGREAAPPSVRSSATSTCGTAISATRCRSPFPRPESSRGAAFPPSKPPSIALTSSATGGRSVVSRRRR